MSHEWQVLIEDTNEITEHNLHTSLIDVDIVAI